MNSNNIATANAVSVQAAAPPTPKQCCGCCCDHRRAVIIVDMIIVVLEALILILFQLELLIKYLWSKMRNCTRPRWYSVVFQLQQDYSPFTGLIFLISGPYCSIWHGSLLDMLPASFMSFSGVTINKETNSYETQYYSYSTTNTCQVNGATIVAQGIIMLLWLYPHIGFTVQVLKGTLAKDSYAPRSCCCFDNSAVARIDQQTETPVVVTNASRMEEGIKQKEYEL